MIISFYKFTDIKALRLQCYVIKINKNVGACIVHLDESPDGSPDGSTDESCDESHDESHDEKFPTGRKEKRERECATQKEP